jgi:AcrR family transcriptional regulator
MSKRELYAQFDDKQALLTAGITARAKRMRAPAELPPPTNRNELTATLQIFGEMTLRELTGPIVVAVYRLALSETARSPEVAEILNRQGREANHRALSELIERAQSLNLLGSGDPRGLAEQFFALLVGDLMLRLLLGIAKRPSSGEIRIRASDATSAFLTLHARCSR